MRHRLRHMTPGRVEPPEAVLHAASNAAGPDAADPNAAIPAAGILDGLRELAGTSGPVLPLNTDGDAAWEAVLAGLLAPGDRVLTVEGGPDGRRLTALAARQGLDLSGLGAPPGMPLDAETLERGLASDTRFKALLLPAVESATATAHPLAELAGVASARGVLMLVDGDHALGVSGMDFDHAGLDALVANGHAGPMLPRGVALAALSERAWRAMEERGAEAPEGAPDLLAARERCLAGGLPFGIDPARAAAMHAAVAESAAQGVAELFARNEALGAACRAGLRALGLDTVARDGHAHGLTAVRLPAGVPAELLALAMSEEYGILARADAQAGLRGLDGRVLVLAHHAPLDYGDVLAALAALRACLSLVGGHTASRDALEAAMAAYERSLFGAGTTTC